MEWLACQSVLAAMLHPGCEGQKWAHLCSPLSVDGHCHCVLHWRAAGWPLDPRTVEPRPVVLAHFLVDDDGLGLGWRWTRQLHIRKPGPRVLGQLSLCYICTSPCMRMHRLDATGLRVSEIAGLRSAGTSTASRSATVSEALSTLSTLACSTCPKRRFVTYAEVSTVWTHIAACPRASPPASALCKTEQTSSPLPAQERRLLDRQHAEI